MTGVSFDECFREHFARLVALGEVMSGSRDTACELAQESFLRLHRHWDTVSGYEDVGGWLRRVMSNLLIDAHRGRASAHRTMELLASRTSGDESVVVDAGDDWSTMVGELPPRQRLIVTLFYGEDMSIRDIAELLDLSPNSVKSALSKARDTLRTRLEGRND